MSYLLDTNICIYIIKNRPKAVIQQLRRQPLEDINVSTITLAELELGVAKSERRETNRLALIEFLSPFRIRDFDQAAAHEYGILRSELETRGTPIGPLDMLIAAHAISLQLILVTNNIKEFRRIGNLHIENWV